MQFCQSEGLRPGSAWVGWWTTSSKRGRRLHPLDAMGKHRYADRRLRWRGWHIHAHTHILTACSFLCSALPAASHFGGHFDLRVPFGGLSLDLPRGPSLFGGQASVIGGDPSSHMTTYNLVVNAKKLLAKMRCWEREKGSLGSFLLSRAAACCILKPFSHLGRAAASLDQDKCIVPKHISIWQGVSCANPIMKGIRRQAACIYMQPPRRTGHNAVMLHRRHGYVVEYQARWDCHAYDSCPCACLAGVAFCRQSDRTAVVCCLRIPYTALGPFSHCSVLVPHALLFQGIRVRSFHPPRCYHTPLWSVLKFWLASLLWQADPPARWRISLAFAQSASASTCAMTTRSLGQQFLSS